jgi:microcystin degradation protein MlrC
LSARIAIGQISCESNTFSRFVCDLDTVRRTGYIYEGDEVMALRDKSNEVAGMIAAVEGSGHTVVPLLASRWNSSAVVTAECYRHLREHLLAPLEEASRAMGRWLSTASTILKRTLLRLSGGGWAKKCPWL